MTPVGVCRQTFGEPYGSQSSGVCNTLRSPARDPVELNGRLLEPNRRIPLNLDWVEEIRVNTSAVERRTATITTRRTVKKDWQAAWLLRAIACMDLTTLSGDDSAERVKRLCAKAKQPLQDHIVKALGIEELHLTTGAVCVYHAFVETAVKALEGTGIPVAAVSTGFPAGLSPLAERVEEIKRSVEAGASEIDIVITRAHVFNGEWNALYDEVAAFKDACGPAHMKSILGTGDLLTLRNVARASVVAMQAGSDFIKTSTGKEAVNATLPVSLVMVRAIREYAEKTGLSVGFKPAGGIKSAKQALEWMFVMKDELGRPWLEPTLFRYGASTMLADIERQLEHHITGRYSAAYRHHHRVTVAQRSAHQHLRNIRDEQHRRKVLQHGVRPGPRRHQGSRYVWLADAQARLRPLH